MMYPTGCRSIKTILEFAVITAKLLNDQGKEAEAERILKQSLDFIKRYPKEVYECFKKNLGNIVGRGNRLQEQIIYAGLGEVCQRLSSFNEAVEYIEKSLAISRELGKKSEVGENCGSLAALYSTIGNHYKAMEYYEKCLEICLESGERKTEGSCYSGLGTVYNILGKYDEAIKYLEKYMKICQETGQPLNIYYLSLGDTYLKKGQFEKAKEFYRKSLVISREIGDMPEQVNGYAQLGNISCSVGEYRKGVKYVEKALSISSETGNLAGEGKSYGALGMLYCYLEKFEKAIDYCNKSLAIRSKIGDRLGEGADYSCLANVYRCLGEHEKALMYDTMCHDIFESIGHQSGVASKNALSLSADYVSLGQPQKAIECCKKGLDIAQDIGEPVGRMYASLGFAYASEKKFDKAEVFLKKAIKASDASLLDFNADKTKTWVSRDYYKLHVALACICFFLGKTQEAFLVLDLGKAKALQILLEQRRESKTEKEAEDSYRKETWRQLEDGKEEQRLQDIARDIQLKENNSTVLIYNLEFSRPTRELLIWVLNADGELRLREVKPNDETVFPEDWLYKATERLMSCVSVQLRRDCSFFSSSLWQPLSPEFEEDSLLNCLQNVCLPCDSKEKEIVDTSSDAELCVHTKLSSSDNVQSTVSTSGNVVVAATDVSSGDVFPDHVALDVTNEVLSRAGKITEENAENVSDPKPYSTSLYNALIEPVVDLIKGTKLIIVPDKMLFFTPFSMLMDKQGRYLSERYSIQVTPSLHTLALSKQVPRSDSLGPALFVGNPTVGEVLLCGQPMNVPPLPYATIEARALASRFNARPLVEDKATKDRVLECIDSASIIHIAAHGLEDKGEILLAPNVQVKTDEQLPTERSYLLTQRDVINRQLCAKLVVLCCCHTGRGEPTSEGVLGIARSFLCAGARTILVALWALPDFETKVFMEHFYDEICEGSSSCEALQKTMNMFQQSTNIEHQSFRTWAPFTIIGEDTRFTKEDIEEIRSCSRSIVN